MAAASDPASPETGFICPECPGRPQLSSEEKLREHWEALHLPDKANLFETEQRSGHEFEFKSWGAPKICQVCDTTVFYFGCTCKKCGYACHRKCLDKVKEDPSKHYCPGFRQRTNTVVKHIRRLVSGVKRRYVMPFVDIDLTYITPKVIAMSYPASGLEATYRNKVDDVAQLLKAKHGEHFMVFNVSERSYDTAKFSNQVLDFGWADHLAPTLERLSSVCKSMGSWLDLDVRNVVVVHCKGGKGRTGVIIASYFLYAGLFTRAEDALREFAVRRFGLHPRARVGVTQPSQRRFVYYFSQAVSRKLEVKPRRLRLLSVTLRGDVPDFDGHGGCRPVLQIFHNLTTKVVETDERPSYTFRDAYFSFPLGESVVIEGDVLIRGLHRTTAGRTVEMFRCQFHTFFVTSRALTFYKRDLDSAHSDKRFPAAATLSFMFSFEDGDPVVPELSDSDLLRPRSASAGAARMLGEAPGAGSATNAGSSSVVGEEGGPDEDYYDDDEGDSDTHTDDSTDAAPDIAQYFDSLRVGSTPPKASPAGRQISSLSLPPLDISGDSPASKSDVPRSPLRPDVPSPARVLSRATVETNPFFSMQLGAACPPHLAESKAPWYLGKISQAGAERLLRDKYTHGCFLVRQAGAQWFVSVLGSTVDVSHFPVKWTGAGFSVEGGEFPDCIFRSLDDLVEFFSHETLAFSDAGESIVLRRGVGVEGLPLGNTGAALRSLNAIDRKSGRHSPA
eukprot:m.241967 g.241967  ORF g.241967 m.241967 type:complete len:731 (+) comp13941_c0_seq1:10-2202(+)